MHSAIDNIKLKPFSDPNVVMQMKLLMNSVCSKYQVDLETSMRGNDFIFDSV